jgi:phosphoglycerate dehydrogenase-like enzyme
MKILFNTPFKLTTAQLTELSRIAPGAQIVEQAGLPENLMGAGVTVLVGEQVPRDLSAWTDLRWVQLLSAGANQLLNHPVLERPVTITTASGLHGVPIAQYVTATWLMLVHRMPQLLEFKRTHVWPNRVALAGFSLRGLTVGIIGYGSIGRECARQLDALGMRVLCLKRDPAKREDRDYNAWPGTGDPAGSIPANWFGPGQLGEMLPQCDLVVVTVPSTPKTEGMIAAPELALMKPSARMIIISRGGIVDEAALADALRTGGIAEAVVDCFVREPLPSEHFFFDVPNLILTPHMSGVYEGYWPAVIRLFGDNLRRFANGAPLLNEMSRQHGY